MDNDKKRIMIIASIVAVTVLLTCIVGRITMSSLQNGNASSVADVNENSTSNEETVDMATSEKERETENAESDGEKAEAVASDVEKDSEKELDEKVIFSYTKGKQSESSNTADTSFDMSKIESFFASSTLIWNGTEYPVSQIVDSSLDLAWQEGVEGFGEGEYVALYFNDMYALSGMVIYAGYQKSQKLYYENGRPQSIQLTFSDGSSQSFALEDKCSGQTLMFNQPINTDYVRITILSVYEGKKYEDTSISEVKFF